jgi:hypothetical protein
MKTNCYITDNIMQKVACKAIWDEKGLGVENLCSVTSVIIGESVSTSFFAHAIENHNLLISLSLSPVH